MQKFDNVDLYSYTNIVKVLHCSSFGQTFNTEYLKVTIQKDFLISACLLEKAVVMVLR